LYANRRISELANLTQEQIIGISVNRLIDQLLLHAVDSDPDQAEKNRQSILDAIQGRGPRSVEFVALIQHKTRYLRLQVFEVTDAEGKTIGHGQILRDTTQIREIDRMKSSLISTVSHELRTPLAGIKGYVTTLLADDVEWDKIAQREFLEIISFETDRLTKLVSDLLDMSRIEAGSLDVSRVECSLVEIVERAAKQAYPAFPERVAIDIPPEFPHLLIDPQRIEAVLRNLIENAAKYAGDHSRVQVSARLDSGEAVIKVKDDGPGIPAEYSQRVFESFYRVGDGLTNPVPGAGLGLAICQGFVSAHGGSIWIEPQEIGTCIAFSLPLSPLANPASPG
jgi:signal transduction histidine kinase